MQLMRYWQFENTLKDWAYRSGAVIEIIFLLYISITDKIFRGFLVIWLYWYFSLLKLKMWLSLDQACASVIYVQQSKWDFTNHWKARRLFQPYTVNGLRISPFQISKKSKACQPLNMFNGPEWIIYKKDISHLFFFFFFLSKHWGCWGGKKRGTQISRRTCCCWCC